MSVNEKMTAIADAIRGKTGKTDALTLDQMAEEIAGIETGGGQWTTDGVAGCSEPNGDLTINVEVLGNYALYNRRGITSLNAPNLIQLAGNALYGCSALKSISIPKCQSLGQNCLGGTAIEELECPMVFSIGYGNLSGMPSIKQIDLGVRCKSLAAFAFGTDPNLATIILRYPNGVTLENTAAFNATPFASGGAGGEIYVPQALIDSGFYTTATNWSVVNEYGTITWKAIEGSEYE